MKHLANVSPLPMTDAQCTGTVKPPMSPLNDPAQSPERFAWLHALARNLCRDTPTAQRSRCAHSVYARSARSLARPWRARPDRPLTAGIDPPSAIADANRRSARLRAGLLRADHLYPPVGGVCRRVCLDQLGSGGMLATSWCCHACNDDPHPIAVIDLAREGTATPSWAHSQNTCLNPAVTGKAGCL